jgi:hypothetical protein
MTEFEAQVLADLHVLKSQMEQVMGIGQPGRLHQLEGRVSVNEEGLQKMKGFAAAFGTALTLVHLAISYFAGKHN